MQQDSPKTAPRRPAAEPAEDGPRILKKYPNRRLYDTRNSSYITLADVKQMVLDHESFEVRDAKSGEELTRSILLQIILEEETAGMPMFSTQMLAQVIRFYGHAMQGLMGNVLERNLQAFVDLQARIAEQSRGLYEGQAFTPDAWARMIGGQAPVPGVFGDYLEQTRKIYSQMQEQMRAQTEALLQSVPGFNPQRDDKA